MSTSQPSSNTKLLGFELKIPPKNNHNNTKPETYSLKIKPPPSHEQHSYSQPPLSIDSIPHIAIDSYPLPYKRINGITLSKTIIYGNITNRLEGSPDYSAILPTSNNYTGSSFDGSHATHRRTSRTNNTYDTEEWFQWTVYVRGPQNEDLSYFIDKVVFILHETYVNPIRVIESPPFEVTECGWGQFEVKIEIYFHSIPSIENINVLKLNNLSLFNHNNFNNNNNNNTN
eukprot:869928_1